MRISESLTYAYIEIIIITAINYYAHIVSTCTHTWRARQRMASAKSTIHFKIEEHYAKRKAGSRKFPYTVKCTYAHNYFATIANNNLIKPIHRTTL